MASSTTLALTCLAITACAAVFMIVSITLPQWYRSKFTVAGQTTIKTDMGLFKYCRERAGSRLCINYKGELLEGVYL